MRLSTPLRKIAFFNRFNEVENWGGDIVALESIMEGLQELGYSVFRSNEIDHRLEGADFVFLANSCLDLRPHYHLLRMLEKPYGIIPMHENSMHWNGPALGFFHYVTQALKGVQDDSHSFSLDRLREIPDLIYYYPGKVRRSSLINYDVFKHASFCMANTPTEAAIIKRDCPSCDPKVIPLSPGLAEGSSLQITQEFLQWTGLCDKGYILQVGRMEPRKNQLASIIATKDLDIPLVFIATRTNCAWYELECIKILASMPRKAPVLIISQVMPAYHSEWLHILPMPGGEKLPRSTLLSAYAHSGLNLHPAFQELPGYIYLESARLGIPTIASTWTTIKDYFTDPITHTYTLDERIAYAPPHHLVDIENLVKKNFGKRYPRLPEHPIFQRTGQDVAREILSHLI